MKSDDSTSGRVLDQGISGLSKPNDFCKYYLQYIDYFNVFLRYYYIQELMHDIFMLGVIHSGYKMKNVC